MNKKRILGIVAEYNPMHNGHLYHIKESKKIVNPDYTVAVVSGNFTQRGETSIIDKWQKAKNVVENGIDMCVELPTIYSVSSAENFANGAIKILSEIGVTDISFGAETDDLESLQTLANLFNDEPIEYKNMLKDELNKGLSFPKARENAVCRFFNDERFRKIIDKSNNILAIEYIKNILKINSNLNDEKKINPIIIKRKNVDYNSNEVVENFASSSKIREFICNNEFDKIKNVVPQNTYDLLMNNLGKKTLHKTIADFEKIIIYKLRMMSIDEIKNISDVSEGLENLIKSESLKKSNLNDLIDGLKSKRYTRARIQRILTCILLGITKDDIQLSKEVIPYISVLAFNDKGKEILSLINQTSNEKNEMFDNNINDKLKVIVNGKDIEKLDNAPKLKRLFEIDKNAEKIFTIY